MSSSHSQQSAALLAALNASSKGGVTNFSGPPNFGARPHIPPRAPLSSAQIHPSIQNGNGMYMHKGGYGGSSSHPVSSQGSISSVSSITSMTSENTTPGNGQNIVSEKVFYMERGVVVPPAPPAAQSKARVCLVGATTRPSLDPAVELPPTPPSPPQMGLGGADIIEQFSALQARVAELEAANASLKNSLYKVNTGEPDDAASEFTARIESEAQNEVLVARNTQVAAQLETIEMVQLEVEAEFGAILSTLENAEPEALPSLLAGARATLSAVRAEAESRRGRMAQSRLDSSTLDISHDDGAEEEEEEEEQDQAPQEPTMAEVEAQALLEAREAQLSEYQQEAGHAHAEIMILQSNIKALKRQLTVSERKSVALAASQETLQAENASLVSQLEAAKAAHGRETELAAKVAKFRTRISELEDVVVAKNDLIRQLSRAAAVASEAGVQAQQQQQQQMMMMEQHPSPVRMAFASPSVTHGSPAVATPVRASRSASNSPVSSIEYESPVQAALAVHAPLVPSPGPLSMHDKFAELRKRLRERREFSDSESDSDTDDDEAMNPSFKYLLRECARVLSPRYEFLERIAANEDNAVFRARQRSTGEVVALKILDGIPPGVESKEVVCLKSVQGHPCVQKLIEYVPLPRHHCQAVVTEFVQVGDVDPTDEGAVKAYLFDLLCAVEHCHSRSIINRDIKPANVMYDKIAKKAVLIDFDCATPFSATHLPRGRVGTDGFFAPEIDPTHKHHNRRRYGPQVDVWCVGLTFGNILFRGLLEKKTRLFYREITCILSQVQHWGPEHELLLAMLQIVPSKRITVQDALAHPWFDDLRTRWTSASASAPTL